MTEYKANILGVAIDSTLASSVLSELEKIANGGSKKPIIIFTPNPEFIVEASRDEKFREMLNQADISLPDGSGLVWAGKLLGQPIKERVSGADVVEGLLEAGNKKWPASTSLRLRRGEAGNWTIGIAGARRGVLEEAEELIKRLQEKYPNVNFVNLDSHSENSEDSEDQKNRKIRLSDSQISLNHRRSELYPSFLNIVFACHGMKKQETWIMENRNKVNANVFMGIGGSLDFLTGFSKRAPVFMRGFGLEWLWRGLQKPTHFKRVWKAIVVFGWMAVKEKVRLSYC